MSPQSELKIFSKSSAMCNSFGDGTPRRERESYIWIGVRGVIKTIARYKKQEKQHLSSPQSKASTGCGSSPLCPGKGLIYIQG